ncbi:hypothetical protein DB346_13590 [Verrucomicrobia bacterium LW23]|nr:hypothetical protein DB346_13590 [Verrucomicrobia bacterium LW23]
MSTTSPWKRATAAESASVLPMMQDFCEQLHIPWIARERAEQVDWMAQHPEAGGVWVAWLPPAEAGEREAVAPMPAQKPALVPAGYFVVTFGFSFEFRGKYGLLDELYVSPAFRKHGLGRGALDEYKAMAPGLGLRRLLIEVAVDSPHLAEYYTRHGFALREYRLHTREVAPGNPPYPPAAK